MVTVRSSRTSFLFCLALAIGGAACGDGSEVSDNDTATTAPTDATSDGSDVSTDTAEVTGDTTSDTADTTDTSTPDGDATTTPDTDDATDTTATETDDDTGSDTGTDADDDTGSDTGTDTTTDADDAADTTTTDTVADTTTTTDAPDTVAPPTVDWCRLQFPLDLTVEPSTTTTVYGRVYVAGLTDLTDANDVTSALVARAGYGPDGSDPATWTHWNTATPNAGWNGASAGEADNDEYQASLVAPADNGSYDFAFAFSYDGGTTWTYCDRNAGAGHDGAEDGYQPASAGQLTVSNDDCVPNPCTTGRAPSCDGTTSVTYATNGTCDSTSGSAVCTYAEAGRTQCAGTAAPFCAGGQCVDARPAGVGDLVIAEVMADPDAALDSDGEWFELQSVTTDAVNLNGLVVTDATGVESFTIDEDVVVAAGGVVVLGRSDVLADNGGVDVDFVFSGMTLGNGSDTLRVLRGASVIDAVTWEALWPFTTGVAMNLPPSERSASDNDLPAAWCEAYAVYGDGDLGTPGTPNDVCSHTIDWCRLQFPTSYTTTSGATFDVYGQLWIAGLTDASASANPHPLVRGEVGQGPVGTPPATWTGWSAAAVNAGFNGEGSQDNDEYKATLTAPVARGDYDFAFRFSGDAGATWTYCDKNAGAGSDGSEDGYDSADAGKLTVTPCTASSCTAGQAATCDGNDVVTYGTAGTCTATGDTTFTCAYPEATRTSCGAQFCAAGACVGHRNAGVGDLVITEVMGNPNAVNDEQGEWFEVENIASVSVNFKGLVFKDGSSVTATVADDLIIAPGATALFVRTATGNGGLTPDALFTFGLNNSGGDEITIRRDGTLIDKVDFASTGMNLPFTAGVSLQLAPNKKTAADNDIAANWCVGTTTMANNDKGTPDAANTPCSATIGWCRLQAPASATVAAGATLTVYGRYWSQGLTDVNQTGNDTSPFVRAGVGVSPLSFPGTDPSSWTWTDATANAGYGTSTPGFEANNDEWQGTLTAPAAGGEYRYAFRFSGDSGATWTYCDLDTGDGHDGAEDGFDADDAGALTATTACFPNPCTPPAATCSGDDYVTYGASTCAIVSGNAECTPVVASTTDCTTTDQRCSAAGGGCVECVGDGDCAPVFEACDNFTCVVACDDDDLEDNDTFATPHVLVTDTLLEGLVLCDADGDWFAIDAIEGQDLDLLVEFEHDTADVGLTLYDPTGNVAVTANDVFDSEAISFTTTAAGRWVFVVRAPPGQQALYDLTAVFQLDACTPNPCDDPPDGCQGDVLEVYTSPGTCTVNGVLADCAYDVATSTDCSADGKLCSQGELKCVECLSVTDCDADFEVCDATSDACVYTCTDDALEPNDSAGAARVLTADVDETDLVICNDDGDFFTLDVLEGHTIDALITFDAARAALTLRLIDPDGAVVAEESGNGDAEILSYTVPAGEGGVYTLSVTAGPGEHNLYDLLVDWYVDACAANPCTSPAPPTCVGSHLVTQPNPGACTRTGSGRFSCDYTTGALDVACPDFCNDGACTDWRPVALEGDLVISEVMADATAVAGDYVEIHNASGDKLELKDVTWRSQSSGTSLALPTFVLDVDGDVLIAASADPVDNGGITPDIVLPGFSITHIDTVTLEKDALVIDAVAYDGLFGLDDGLAMNLDPTVLDDPDAADLNDLEASWCPATSTYGSIGERGTPGAPNDACTVPLIVGYCRLQHPPTLDLLKGATGEVYGRVYIAGVTDQNTNGNDIDPRVKAQVGYGPVDSSPVTDPTWVWVDAPANPTYVVTGNPVFEPNNDEYLGTLTAPNTVGTYHYAVRFTADSGLTWLTCDKDGTTDDGSLGYETAQAGVLTVTAPPLPTLLITEYVEGSSNNKAVEITNIGASSIDLAARTCALRWYNSGTPPHTTISNTVNLTNTLAAGASWVVCDDSANATILAACNQQNTGTFYNGDDPVQLVCDGVIVDAIGQTGVQATFAQDMTLHRKCTVTAGDTVGDDAFDLTSWDQLPQDTLSGLGTHAPPVAVTVTGVANKPLVIDALDLVASPRKVRVRNTTASAVSITTSYQWCEFPDYAAVVGSATSVPANGVLTLSLPAVYDFGPTSSFELALYASGNFASSTDIIAYLEGNVGNHTRESTAVSAGLWTAGDAIPITASDRGVVLKPTATIGSSAAYQTFGGKCKL